MKIAIMQPYFLPYLGYFQLLKAVDTFVFFDDVNYIKNGWINKNQILIHHQAYKFTIPLNKVSQNRYINELKIYDYMGWRQNFLKIIQFNYKKAPQFSKIYEWLTVQLHKKEYEFISNLAADSVIAVSNLLNISVKFLYSSQLDYGRVQTQNGQEKIINICGLLGASDYINPFNGATLYNNVDFHQKGINLHFLKMNDIRYEQVSKKEFIPYLSILDVLMFNEIKIIDKLLNNYKLV